MTAHALRALPLEQASLLSAPLLALWHSAQKNWNAAHSIAQDVETPDGSLVHAFLHRQEGDAFNASYWYRRAGRPVFKGSLEAEWEAITSELLARIGDEEGKEKSAS